MFSARLLRSGISKMSAPNPASPSHLSTAAAAIASTPNNASTQNAPPPQKHQRRSRSPPSTAPSTPSTRNPKLYSGIFGLNKPSGISSAQALRDIQAAFNSSPMFAASIQAAQDKAAADAFRSMPGRGGAAQRRADKARRKHREVKIGHGGTLDPLATGVLIVGLFGGTRALANFMGKTTKRYRATVLFGAATDSYDVKGQVVARAPYEHVSRAAVEGVLDRFRGEELMQKPPIYSALHMDGKRLYEYAREGKALPREIEARPTAVYSLELTDWMEAGTHEHRWPDKCAPLEARRFAGKTLDLAHVVPDAVVDDLSGDEQDGSKKDTETTAGAEQADVTMTTNDPGEKRKHAASDADDAAEVEQPASKKARADGDSTTTSTTTPAPPAAVLDMSVASGFYVRSLCHDLGMAVGSLGMMATLERTQQGDFALGGDNVLEYEDLARGEEVWGPKVERMLAAWNESQKS